MIHCWKRMEAFVKRKREVVEGLLSTSLRMLEHSRADQITQLSEKLIDREHLLQELKHLDEKLDGRKTPYDAEWAEHIRQVQKWDDEVIAMTKYHRQVSAKLLSWIQQTKRELVEIYELDPKGNQIEAQG